MAIITSGDLSDLHYQRTFRANGSTVTLKKISETDWMLIGDLAEGDSEGFPPPSTCQWNLIGDECDGWWYIGDMDFDGVPHMILLGGEELERTGLQWKTEGTATPGTYNFSDGLAATEAMMEAPSLHPAGEYCHSINPGFSYMPSISEIRLAYTNRELLTGIGMSGNYWSSTQSSADGSAGRQNARYLNFSTGSITGNYAKTSTTPRTRPAMRVPKDIQSY